MPWYDEGGEEVQGISMSSTHPGQREMQLICTVSLHCIGCRLYPGILIRVEEN